MSLYRPACMYLFLELTTNIGYNSYLSIEKNIIRNVFKYKE